MKWLSLILVLSVSLVRAEEYSPMTLGDATLLPKDKAVVLITEISNCPFCSKIKQEFLGPISKAPEFGPYISVVSLNLESQAMLTDFNGEVLSQDQWASKMGVDFSPTILIIDPNSGRRLADDLVGFTTPDFYGFYLEQNIQRGMRFVSLE